MKPTTIGSANTLSVTEAALAPLPLRQLRTVPPLDTGAIVLNETQNGAVEAAVAELDFATMPSNEILRLGYEAEQSLQRTLDGFLTRLGSTSSQEVFALFARLKQGVDEADLPAVVQAITAGEKPGVLARVLIRLGVKTPNEAAREAYEHVRGLVSGHTKTLADLVSGLEKELGAKVHSLVDELQTLDALKGAYGTHFSDFTIAAAVTKVFLERARADVAEERAKVEQAPSVVGQATLAELQAKLQLLESRALALEGSYTRLPADALVIQQLEAAGVGTLQEVMTTSSSRVASIKMTLLTVHGAFEVRSVQQLSAQARDIDSKLLSVRGSLMKDVVTTAANAPGDNRLAQAAQIETVIAETQELYTIVAAAHTSNAEKFATAREKFRTARAALATLSSEPSSEGASQAVRSLAK